jgi:tape measure domain-containing protein
MAGSVLVEIKLENGQFKMAAQESELALKKLTQSAQGTGAGAGGLKQLAGGLDFVSKSAKAFMALGIVSFFVNIGKSALGISGQIEKATVAITQFTGSADVTKRVMKDLQELASKSPLEQAPLIENTKQLLAAGVGTDDVIKKLRMLGDAALGDQAAMDGLVYTYAKIAKQGRVQGDELNQIADKLPIYNELQKVLGVNTPAAVRKMVEQGRVGFAEIDKAITSMTTGSGKFAGTMEKMASTLPGKFSTFTDNIKMSMGAMGDEASPGFKALLDVLIRGSESGTTFATVLSYIGKIAGTIAGSIALMVQDIKNLISAAKYGMAWVESTTTKDEAVHARRIEREKELNEGLENRRKISQQIESIWTSKGSGAAGTSGAGGTKTQYQGGEASQGKKLTREQFENEFMKIGLSAADEARAVEAKRLKDLEDFKRQKIISETEYQTARGRVESEANEKILKDRLQFGQQVLGFASQQMGQLSQIYSMIFQQENQQIQQRANFANQMMDMAKQAAMAEAGVIDEVKSAQLDKEVKDIERKLNKERNVKKRHELQEQLDLKNKEKKKAQIEEEYAKKKEALDFVNRYVAWVASVRQFEIQKRLNMAQTITSTATGVMQGFATFGPIGGAIAAGATLGMGAAMIAMIAGQSPPPFMASGGYMQGSPTGSLAVLAEKNRGEAVVPLDNPQVMEKFRDALGGDQVVHTHIYLDGRVIGEQVDQYTRDRGFRMNARNYAFRGAY